MQISNGPTSAGGFPQGMRTMQELVDCSERDKPPMKPINNVPKAVVNRLHQKKHQERQLQHSRQLLTDQLFLQFSDSKTSRLFFLKQRLRPRI